MNDGSTLLASGDLGDGNDVLDVAGTLDTGGGTFSLGAGDDTFVVHNTTAVIGTLDAGAGNDLLNVNVDSGNLVPLGSTTGFESLGKSGLGALEINGASDFLDVQVQAGLLDISAGGSIEAQTATVSSGATLNVDGALAFTTGADDLHGRRHGHGRGHDRHARRRRSADDPRRCEPGRPCDFARWGLGNDTLTANIATSATLGGVTGFETLTKDGAGTLNVAGPANSSFATVLVQDGVLDVAAAANVSGRIGDDGRVRRDAECRRHLCGQRRQRHVHAGRYGERRGKHRSRRRRRCAHDSGRRRAEHTDRCRWRCHRRPVVLDNASAFTLDGATSLASSSS